MKVAVLLLVLAALSLRTYALGAEEVYPVDILLNTTSDWTDVTFFGGTSSLRRRIQGCIRLTCRSSWQRDVSLVLAGRP